MNIVDRQKSKRVYDSRGRQMQARRNREAILDTARSRFLSDGYATTTIASIASDAGMSVDAVNKAFGGKAGLVRAIYERSLAGQGEVPAPSRSDALRGTVRDPRALVHEWGVLGSEVAPLVAPIHLLVRDAAVADPEMADLLRDSDAQRRGRMRQNAETLADNHHLRAGMTLEQATDVLWTYSSPELYELLVVRCDWDANRYGQFVGDSLASALLE
jgi:AcrR family transcriptional regulator